MILPLVVFAAVLAQINAQDFDTACVAPIAPYIACAGYLTGDCAAGETLFDVIDPALLCNALVPGTTQTCQSALATTTKQLDNQGCCTLNSLYPAMESTGSSGNCSTGSPLSYEGFSQVISYVCAKEVVESEDFYCITDGRDYLENVIQPTMLTFMTMTDASDGEKAEYFNANINCTFVQDTQCCYPSIAEFIGGCGDAEAQALLPGLTQLQTALPALCGLYQTVPLDLTTKCTGLTEIDNCFASDDENCTGDDDDAAFSVMPTFASAFAAVAGFLFFARQF